MPARAGTSGSSLMLRPVPGACRRHAAPPAGRTTTKSSSFLRNCCFLHHVCSFLYHICFFFVTSVRFSSHLFVLCHSRKRVSLHMIHRLKDTLLLIILIVGGRLPARQLTEIFLGAHQRLSALVYLFISARPAEGYGLLHCPQAAPSAPPSPCGGMLHPPQGR